MNWPCGVKGAGGRGGNTGIHKSVCVCVCIVKYILNYLDLCLIYAAPNTF